MSNFGLLNSVGAYNNCTKPLTNDDLCAYLTCFAQSYVEDASDEKKVEPKCNIGQLWVSALTELMVKSSGVHDSVFIYTLRRKQVSLRLCEN